MNDSQQWADFLERVLAKTTAAQHAAETEREIAGDVREEARRRFDRESAAASAATNAVEERLTRLLRESEERLRAEHEAIERRAVDGARGAAVTAATAAATSALEDLAAVKANIENLRKGMDAATAASGGLDSRLRDVEQNGAKVGGKLWIVFVVVAALAGGAAGAWFKPAPAPAPQQQPAGGSRATP